MSTRTGEQDMSTDEQLAADPQAFDEKLAGLYEAWQKATDNRERLRSDIHEAAGDRREYRGRARAWRRTLAEVEQTVRQMAKAGESLPLRMGHGRTAADLLLRLDIADSALAQAMLAVQSMEAIYRKAPWQRFFPCTNRDGHIHATYRDCSSVGWDTPMAWRPDLSGLTVDAAVAKLGPALCSICFPLAPVEQKSMTLGQVEQERTRAEREAAAAARQAKKDAKQLAEDEVFVIQRDTRFHDTITTVAGAVEVLRTEVEFRDYYGHGGHSWHAGFAAGALVATRILLEREARHPGWGRTQAQIDQIIANAVKKNIKDGARLDPKTGQPKT